MGKEMGIQERLVSLSKFNAGLNMLNGNFIVTITYDGNWDVVKPTNPEVIFERDDGNPNMYYYAAPMSMDINAIFESIDETIEYNREIEQKVELFGIKHAELLDLFKSESYENLMQLEFVIPSSKKSGGKRRDKRNSKQKEESAEAECTDKEKDTKCEENQSDNSCSNNNDGVIKSEIDDKIAEAMSRK